MPPFTLAEAVLVLLQVAILSLGVWFLAHGKR
jgi:hypothetical protein